MSPERTYGGLLTTRSRRAVGTPASRSPSGSTTRSCSPAPPRSRRPPPALRGWRRWPAPALRPPGPGSERWRRCPCPRRRWSAQRQAARRAGTALIALVAVGRAGRPRPAGGAAVRAPAPPVPRSRAGDEHAGPHLQAQVAEIGPAQDVGHRLVRGPPGDQGPVGGRPLRGQRAIVLGVEVDALQPRVSASSSSASSRGDDEPLSLR